MKQSTKIFLFALLGSVVIGLLLGPGQDYMPDSIGGVVEGEYSVVYYDQTTETTNEVGVLSIRFGTYVFILEMDIEIPEHLVEQIPFIRSTEGTYKIDYPFDYQPTDEIGGVEDGASIAEIIFVNFLRLIITFTLKLFLQIPADDPKDT